MMLVVLVSGRVARKNHQVDASAEGRSEERFLRAIRQLTEDTRQARLELEALVKHPPPDRSRSSSHDRVIARRSPTTKRNKK